MPDFNTLRSILRQGFWRTAHECHSSSEQNGLRLLSRQFIRQIAGMVSAGFWATTWHSEELDGAKKIGQALLQPFRDVLGVHCCHHSGGLERRRDTWTALFNGPPHVPD